MQIAYTLLAILATIFVLASNNFPIDLHVFSRKCNRIYQPPFGMAIDATVLKHENAGKFDNDFSILYDSINGLLNAARSDASYPTGCAKLFPRNITSGASPAKYNSSPLGVALNKYPNSPIPTRTINCIGCTDPAKPCMADSDCGKPKCNSGTNFDDGNAPPGCSQNKFHPTASNDMHTYSSSFFKNKTSGDFGEVFRIKFCGIDQFTNPDMKGLVAEHLEAKQTPKHCYPPNEHISKNTTVPYLKPLPDGQTVLAAPPILPGPTIKHASAGRFQMAHHGQFSMFSGADLIRMGQNFIQKLGKMSYAKKKCRRNRSLMPNQFLGTWTLYPYMDSVDSGACSDQYDPGPAMSNMVSQMYTRHKDDGYHSSQPQRFLYDLPETDNLQRLLKTAVYSAPFTLYPHMYSFDGIPYPDQYDPGPIIPDMVSRMFTRQKDEGYYSSQIQRLLNDVPETRNFQHLLKRGNAVPNIAEFPPW